MNIYNVFLSGAIKYLSHSCVSLLLCCSNITHPAQHIRITALMTIFHVLVLFIMTFSCRLLCLEGILGIGSLQRFQHMENYVILLGSCWPIELQPETPSCTLLLLVFQEKSENSAAKKKHCFTICQCCVCRSNCNNSWMGFCPRLVVLNCYTFTFGAQLQYYLHKSNHWCWQK